MQSMSSETAQPSMRARLIALTVAFAVMLPLSLIAARWQWNRHIERDARNELILSHVSVSAAPDVRTLLSKSPDGQLALTPAQEWLPASAQGAFSPSNQKLWRKQPLNGEPGFIVITPFVTQAGDTLLVERGWVPAIGRLPDPAVSLAVSNKTQSITVRLRLLPAGPNQDPADLPMGQTNSPQTMLSPSTVRATFELITATAAGQLTPIPLPELDGGPHLGYVGQWLLIGAATVFVYFNVLRRARIDSRQASEIKSA